MLIKTDFKLNVYSFTSWLTSVSFSYFEKMSHKKTMIFYKNTQQKDHENEVPSLSTDYTQSLFCYLRVSIQNCNF